MKRSLAILSTIIIGCGGSAVADPGNVGSTYEIAHHGSYIVFSSLTAAGFDGEMAYHNSWGDVVGHVEIHVSWTLKDQRHSTFQEYGWIKNTRHINYVYAYGILSSGSAGQPNGGVKIAECPKMREASNEDAGYKFHSSVCQKQDQSFTRHNMTIWFRFGLLGFFWLCHVRSPVAHKVGHTYWFSDARNLAGVGGDPSQQDHVKCVMGVDAGGQH